MSSLCQTEITVQPRDFLSVDEHETQSTIEIQGGAALTSQADVSVNQALQDGHLTTDQALWLHEQQRSWQISVERFGQSVTVDQRLCSSRSSARRFAGRGH